MNWFGFFGPVVDDVKGSPVVLVHFLQVSILICCQLIFKKHFGVVLFVVFFAQVFILILNWYLRFIFGFLVSTFKLFFTSFMFNVYTYLMLRFATLFHTPILSFLPLTSLWRSISRFRWFRRPFTSCFWTQVFTVFAGWLRWFRLLSFRSADGRFFFADYTVYLFVNSFDGSASFAGLLMLLWFIY